MTNSNQSLTFNEKSGSSILPVPPEKNTERYDNYFRVDIGMTRKNGNLFGLKYDTYWQIMNVSRHLNIFTYAYRTRRDINTGNQLGVERRAVPMFPLIFTFGVRFDF